MAKKEKGQKRGGFLVVSLGGSIVSNPEGVNVNGIKKLAPILISAVKNGLKLIIIIGGGRLCREYLESAIKISRKIKERDADWIGIYATRINASLVKAVLKPFTPDDIIYPLQSARMALRKHKCVVGGGIEPGGSSDLTAVRWAQFANSKTILNITNIDYVYSKDPRVFKDTKPLKDLTWDKYLSIIDRKYKPGGSWPFDPKASVKAKKLGITVKIVNGSRIKEIYKAILGKKFLGTIIHP